MYSSSRSNTPLRGGLANLSTPATSAGHGLGSTLRGKANFTVDDILEGVNLSHIPPSDLVNIQEPVKQLILSLAKAIKEQAIQIATLEQGLPHLVTSDRLADALSRYSSRDSLHSSNVKIDTKADKSTVDLLKNQIDHATTQLNHLSDTATIQNGAIADLGGKLDRIMKDIENLKRPNYEEIYRYIDRQMESRHADLERKISTKADLRDVELAVPENLEKLYRGLYSSVEDMKLSVVRMATKEELANKADINALKDLSASVSERVSKQDLHSAVNVQVKPLVNAVASLEKTIQIHQQAISEKKSNQSLAEFWQQLATSGSANGNSGASTSTSTMVSGGGMAQNAAALSQETQRIRGIVDDALNQRRVGEVTPLTIQSALATHTEQMLREMGSMGESIRLEVMTSYRDHTVGSMRGLEEKIRSLHSAVKDLKDAGNKSKSEVKDLKQNVTTMSETFESKYHLLQNLVSKNDYISQQVAQLGQEISSINSKYSSLNQNITSVTQTVAHLSHEALGPSHPLSSSVSGGLSASPQIFPVYIPAYPPPAPAFPSVPPPATAHPVDHTAGNHSTAPHHPEGNVINITVSTDHPTSSASAAPAPAPTPAPASASESTSGNHHHDHHNHHHHDSHHHHHSSHHNHHPHHHHHSSHHNHRHHSHSHNSSSFYPPLPPYTAGAHTSHAALTSFGERLQAIIRDYDSLRHTVETISDDVRNIRNELTSARNTLSSHISEVKIVTDTKANQADLLALKTSVMEKHTATQANQNDWRIAIGDVSMNLRRELADKAGREELYAVMTKQMDTVDAKICHVQSDLDAKYSSLSEMVELRACVEDVSKISNDLNGFKNRCANELTGARWLWTSGQLVKDGWVPWDVQAVNAAPQVFLWRKGSSSVQVRLPGLYKVAVAMFTSLPVTMQICLNGEPVFSVQPDPSDGSGSGHTLTTFVNAQSLRDDRYTQRRLKHSAGEVSSVAIDEFISVPAEATLAVRFHCAAAAQGFLSLKKL